MSTLGRRSCWVRIAGSSAMIVALLVACPSCAALKLPFGKNAKEESLRKQVEADSFPSAKQAGL